LDEILEQALNSEAIKHAQMSGRKETVEQLIVSTASMTFDKGFYKLLGGWLETLSDSFVRSHFDLAVPQGYRRPFLDELTLVQEILPAVKSVVPKYVASALRESTTSPISAKEDQSPLHEGLSTRETEVLELVSLGLSNSEIADGLYISVGTVKWHINHILRKLDVTNRSKAAIRARELDLI
jgi:ATP/maltotriose-dependent transcriptional regulator MalT